MAENVPSQPLRLHTLPVALAAILCATAVPVELRAPQAWSLGFGFRDFVVNVLLYLPLGLCCWRWPLAAGLASGAALSGGIEFLQLGYFGRQGALFDVIANSLGVAVGMRAERWMVRAGRRNPPASLAIGRLAASVALAGALLLIVAWSWPTRSSSLLNWDASFELLLGNETTRDRPWRGTVRSLVLLPEAVDGEMARGLSAPTASRLRPGAVRPGTYALPAPAVLDGNSAVSLDPEVAHRFFDSAVRNNAFAVVATILPGDVQQSGPARVITFSRGPKDRNFDLGQDGRRLVFRVRTPATGLNGMDPHAVTPGLLEQGKAVTVVASFDGAVARIHVDGRAQGRQDLAAAGCAAPLLCGADLRASAALLGALAAVVVLAVGKPRSPWRRTVLTALAGLSAAALVRWLATDHGAFLGSWGAAAMSCLGAACVGMAAAWSPSATVE